MCLKDPGWAEGLKVTAPGGNSQASSQKGLAGAAFDNWKAPRWSAKMSAGRALGAANDRPSTL